MLSAFLEIMLCRLGELGDLQRAGVGLLVGGRGRGRSGERMGGHSGDLLSLSSLMVPALYDFKACIC